MCLGSKYSHCRPLLCLHLLYPTQLSKALAYHKKISSNRIKYLSGICQVRQNHSSDLAPPIVPLQPNPYHLLSHSRSNSLNGPKRETHICIIHHCLVGACGGLIRLHTFWKRSQRLAPIFSPLWYRNIGGIHGPLVL